MAKVRYRIRKGGSAVDQGAVQVEESKAHADDHSRAWFALTRGDDHGVIAAAEAGIADLGQALQSHYSHAPEAKEFVVYLRELRGGQ
ncbi:hypothetical protein FNV58_00435 (plasmid) [Streptomyces sp. RLB1-9]|nr:hypothetical protein FNV58_00435 [Streptomyces sp. RLB1-9]